MRNNEPILLIGLNVKVKEALNRLQNGIEGIAVGETMKTVIINTKDGDKIIPKKGSIFEVKLPSGEIIRISGDEIICRPEELTKRAHQG